MHKSAKFYFDLNIKDNWGATAFHLACQRGRVNIVEIIMENSKQFKLNLTAKDNNGRTGFQLARISDNYDLASFHFVTKEANFNCIVKAQ